MGLEESDLLNERTWVCFGREEEIGSKIAGSEIEIVEIKIEFLVAVQITYPKEIADAIIPVVMPVVNEDLRSAFRLEN